MNPGTLEEAKKIAGKARRLAGSLNNSEIVIVPPFPFIKSCISNKKTGHFHVGAQSVSTEPGVGPHTGEVSAAMLLDIGVEYAIVGHSEERAMGDSDDAVSKRLLAAVAAGMTAILCVGEKNRDEGGIYLEELKNQIKNSLANVPKKYVGKIILAYEPVWAIGAPEAMNPEQINETSIFVRKAFADIFGSDQGLKARVLYGGAVNFRNAYEIVTVGQVDGLLIGRESINMPGFAELARTVDRIG